MKADVYIITAKKLPDWLKQVNQDLIEAGYKIKILSKAPETPEVLIDLFTKSQLVPKLVLVDIALSAADEIKINNLKTENLESEKLDSLNTLVTIDSYLPPFATAPVLGVFADKLSDELREYLENIFLNLVLLPDNPGVAKGKFPGYLKKLLTNKRKAMSHCANVIEGNADEIHQGFLEAIGGDEDFFDDIENDFL